MSTEENKEIVRRFNSPDEYLTMECLADDYTNRSGTDAPWSVIIKGPDEAKAAFRQMLREHPGYHATIEDMVAEGDKVAIRIVYYEGDKPIENAMVFYRLHDGKIVDDWYCGTELQQS